MEEFAEVTNVLRVVLEGIGWDVYNKIVMLVMGLNLHYVPFFVAMLINWWDTRRSQEAGLASIVEWRRNYTDIYAMMIVAVLFFIPNSNTQMAGNQMAGVDAVNVMDNSFQLSTTPYSVPPGWWFAFKMSNAIIAQLKEWIGTGENYRHILETFSTAKIENDSLSLEVSKFYNNCYRPVFNRWRYERKQPYPRAEDGDDLTYIGNELFQTVPGYYKSCTAAERSTDTCYGFNEKMPVEVAERHGIETNFVTEPDYENQVPEIAYTNTPSCYTWWTGNADRSYSGFLGNEFISLKERLIIYAKDKLMGGVLVEGGAYDRESVMNAVDDEKAELLVKRMLKNDPPTTNAMIDSSPSQNEKSLWESIKGGITDFVASVGATILALLFEITIRILVPLIYMIHALAIFAFIVALPFILLFTRFNPGAVANLIVLLFGLLFLGVIWHLADLLYNHLLGILYGGEDTAFSALSLKETKMQLLFFIFTFFVYLYLPAYVIKYASKVGVKWEDMTNDALKLSDKSQSPGSALGGRALSKIK